MTKPILLAEFSAASLWPTWVGYGAGIWYTDFSGAYPLVDPALKVGIDTKVILGDVGSVIYEGDALLRAESITELLVAPSFYWERSTSTLYARFQEFNPPNDSVRVGVKYYVASQNYDDDEGHIYLALMKDTPPLAQNKDRIFFKKVSTGTWSLTLDNASGLFDDLPNWGVYNQLVQYYIGELGDTIDKFKPIKAGRVKDFTFSGADVKLNVQDLRSRLVTRLPINTLTATEYPNIDDRNVGKLKPVAFGENYAIEPVCLNSKSSGPYVYLIADTTFGVLESVSAVRVDGVVVTPSAVDLNAGTVTLTAAQVKDGTTFKAVDVDVKGHKINGAYTANPLKIIRYLIDYLSLTPYTDDFYDTREWDKYEAEMPNVGIYSTKQIQILTVIEQAMLTTRGGFLITEDGRYTWRNPNYGKRPVYFIRDIDWLAMPEVEYDTDEVLSYVRVGYAKNNAADEYKIVENRTAEREVYNQFNIVNNETFETIAVQEATTSALASDIMSLSKAPAIVVSGSVPLSFFGMQIGTNVQLEVNRFIKGEFVPWLGTIRGEVLSVKPNVLANRMDIEVRVVDGIPEYVESRGAAAVYGLAIYGNTAYGGSNL